MKLVYNLSVPPENLERYRPFVTERVARILMQKHLLLLFLVVSGFFSVHAQTSTAADDHNSIFKPVKWRSIGPFRGGRSNCSTGVIGDPKTYYMGTTGGGLWKTDDMGISWRNISDGFFKTGTVGAIAVSESDPNVVYVGMGEHAVRGVMTHSGDGVYKSTDAGKTWKKIGLDLTQHISRIIVHPKIRMLCMWRLKEPCTANLSNAAFSNRRTEETLGKTPFSWMIKPVPSSYRWMPTIPG